MFKQLVYLLISLNLVLISCKKDSGMSHTVEEKIILIDGSNRYYALAVPKNYNKNDSYPLFLALHWGGEVNPQSGISFLSTFALDALEAFNSIIVSPSCPEESGWTHPNSEQFIFNLLDELKENYNIDTAKIVIGGYSMGGKGTWYYAVNFPNTFKVAVPIASLPSNSLRPITDIIPTYVIHGTDDEIFPIDQANDNYKQIRTNGNIIKFVKVEDASHYDTNKYIKSLSQSIEWIESYLD